MKFATRAAFFLGVGALGLAAEIPAGTHVLLRTIYSVTSRTAAEDNRVYFRTAIPILSGGRIVVPEGSLAGGSVSTAKRSGHGSGRAQLGIRIDSLILPNGKELRASPQVASVESNGAEQKVEGGVIKEGSALPEKIRMLAAPVAFGAVLGALTGSWKAGGIIAAEGAVGGAFAVLPRRGKDVELRPGTLIDVVFDRAISTD